MRKTKPRECMSLEKAEGIVLLYCNQTRQIESGAGVELLRYMNKHMRVSYEYKGKKRHSSDTNNFVTYSRKCISYDSTLQTHEL